MLEFQKRVIEEKDALHKKLEGLRNFIEYNEVYKMLPSDEQGRLRMQHNVMKLYEKILVDRILNFNRC